MSRSDWIKHPKARLAIGLTLALTFCLIFLGYGLLESAKYEREASAKTEEYSRYTREKVAEACVGIPALERIRCLYEATDTQAEYRYNQADLVAQRQSALWAYIMAAAAIIGMVLSAVGVLLVWTTFRETRDANRIMMQQVRASVSIHRAWIKVIEGKAFMKVSVQNDGQTVAQSCAWSLAMRCETFEYDPREMRINFGDEEEWRARRIPLKSLAANSGVTTGFLDAKCEVPQVPVRAVAFHVKLRIEFRTVFGELWHENYRGLITTASPDGVIGVLKETEEHEIFLFDERAVQPDGGEPYAERQEKSDN